MLCNSKDKQASFTPAALGGEYKEERARFKATPMACETCSASQGHISSSDRILDCHPASSPRQVLTHVASRANQGMAEEGVRNRGAVVRLTNCGREGSSRERGTVSSLLLLEELASPPAAHPLCPPARPLCPLLVPSARCPSPLPTGPYLGLQRRKVHPHI